MIVRELITKLGFNTEALAQGARRADGIVGQVRGSLRGLAVQFAAAFGVKEIVNTMDSMQSLRARIEQLPQTVGSAADAFKAVANRAIEARQGVYEYANLYIRLAGATKNFVKSQDDVLAITDTISKALVIGGAQAHEQAAAILQISQAFQKGKLDGDEFRTFMEVMSTDLKDKLAARLGTTTDKLYEWSQSGRLQVKGLAQAFMDMRGEIEDQFKRMPLTIGQAFKIIMGKTAILFDDFNQKTGFVALTSKTLLTVWGHLDRAARDLGHSVDKLAQAFGGWHKVFRLLLAIALAFPALRILRFVMSIFGAIGGGVAVLYRIARAAIVFKSAMLGLGTLLFVVKNGLMAISGILRASLFGVLITALGLLIEDWITWQEGGKSALGSVWNYFANFRTNIKKLIDDVKKWWAELWDSIGNFASKINLDSIGKFFSPNTNYNPRAGIYPNGRPPRAGGNTTIQLNGDVHVPAGTSAQQSREIGVQVGKQIDAAWDRKMREAAGASPAYGVR